MVYKKDINRGIELLQLCQQLQSEKDGINRPDPGVFDKTKQLDQFAIDIEIAIKYMESLHKIMPMVLQLADLGRLMAREGIIVSPEWGGSFSRAALDHVLAEYGVLIAKSDKYKGPVTPELSKVPE